MPFTTLLITAVAATVVLVVATLIVRRFWGTSVIEPTLFVQPPSPMRSDQSPPKATLTSSQEAQIRDLLVHAHKIEAIKQVRAFTGLGLAEAKHWVEQIERDDAVVQPTPMSPIVIRNETTEIKNQQTSVYADHEVQQAIAKGNTIAAIKRVRELTNMGLKEAKDYVDALVAGNSPPSLVAVAQPKPTLEEVASLAASGQKIEAIKRYRELTGVGLKEAKDYVDRLMP